MTISNISLNMDVLSQLLGYDGGASIYEKIITFRCGKVTEVTFTKLGQVISCCFCPALFHILSSL